MKIEKRTRGNIKGSIELLKKVADALALTGQAPASHEIYRVISILNAVECDVVVLQRASIRAEKSRRKK